MYWESILAGARVSFCFYSKYFRSHLWIPQTLFVNVLRDHQGELCGVPFRGLDMLLDICGFRAQFDMSYLIQGLPSRGTFESRCR